MHKILRNAILAATMLAGFAATSYASTGLSNAPEPLPPGVARG